MSRFARSLLGVLAVVLGSSAVLATVAPPAGAAVVLNGFGSTWSYNATRQWVADVARQGLSINFTANGSSAGRVFYYSNEADFAISEIPFQPAYKTADGETTNEVADAAHRPYVYLPIVAGGTSFMYHLDFAGQRVTNLRLKPATLADIFTGVITNWNDPRIAADNGGHAFPSLQITPVTRSDGSGTSAQFTAFMASQTPAIWNAFCAKTGIGATPCPPTSLYPPFAGSIQQALSEGVASYVSAGYGNGTITYVEYSYAKNDGFPVASILNHAGYYTQPTAHNVAIALQGATFNRDNTQNLTGVYNFADPRTYPVSSYSYMIAPTTTAAPFSTEKGTVLSKFILYFLCAGQQEADVLGYSPLPKVLVENGFAANNEIPGHVPSPPIGTCNDPTITGSFITGDAPPPPAGSNQNSPPVGDAASNSGTGNGATNASTLSNQSSGGNGGRSSSGGGATTTTTALAGSNPLATAAGNPLASDASGIANSNGTGQNPATAQAISITRDSGPVPRLYYVVSVLVILLILGGPAAFALWLSRRDERKT
jgi:phosphate transport system substrate-binding protein